MTREEAIEVIEQDIPCEHDRDLIEALEMAISALSTDGEYIKKSELLQHVVVEELSDFKDCDVIHAEVIDELTTYSFPDSAENKGEWINETPHVDGCPIYTCSECGRSNLWESPFCPSCGADMRGDKANDK